MKPNCDCPNCRRGIRILIEQVFYEERTWLGEIGIRVFGHLTWVSPELLRSVLAEMCYLGILILMRDHPQQQRDPISMYILAHLTIPADVRKRGGP